MTYELLLGHLKGEWHDEKGNDWTVTGDEAKVRLVGRDEWKPYQISGKKNKLTLNGAKMMKAEDGIIQWKSPPSVGCGIKWTEGIGEKEEPTPSPDPEEEEPQQVAPTPPSPDFTTRAARIKYNHRKNNQFMSRRSYGYNYSRDSSSEDDDSGTATYPLVRLSPESLKYTPMRLTLEERKDLRIIEAAIRASNYTDVVDDPCLTDDKRDARIYKELEHFLIGLECCRNGPSEGLAAYKAKDLTNPMETAKRLIEIARRHKMGSPNTSIHEYGKLLYLAQDCYVRMKDEWGDVGPVVTAETQVKLHDLGGILEDPRLPLATTPVPRLSSIPELNKALKRKNKVQKQLRRKYGSMSEQVIYSLDDRNVFIEENAMPIAEMIVLAKKFFHPDEPTPETHLSIHEGESGSRLSHDHSKHFYYVVQSLTFWKNILKDMCYLWVLMEQDMLSSASDFRDTGQGKNRVQECPLLYSAVENILQKTKEEVGAWVGSERIHMGDNQVPNGLHFIDKYTQVCRIIRPIINTLSGVENMTEKDSDQLDCIIEVWGSVKNLQLAILRDFFRFGFDGSGGSNDDDAGSCIDGRLTSAWNWCSLLRTKPFYPAFLLSGFSSFDSPK